MRYPSAGMRCGFLNPLKPGQGAILQSARATVGLRGPLWMRLPRASLVGSMLVATWFPSGAHALLLVFAALLPLFNWMPPRGPAT
jgi:hypothetical protein